MPLVRRLEHAPGHVRGPRQPSIGERVRLCHLRGDPADTSDYDAPPERQRATGDHAGGAGDRTGRLGADSGGPRDQARGQSDPGRGGGQGRSRRPAGGSSESRQNHRRSSRATMHTGRLPVRAADIPGFGSTESPGTPHGSARTSTINPRLPPAAHLGARLLGHPPGTELDARAAEAVALSALVVRQDAERRGLRRRRRAVADRAKAGAGTGAARRSTSGLESPMSFAAPSPRGLVLSCSSQNDLVRPDGGQDKWRCCGRQPLRVLDYSEGRGDCCDVGHHMRRRQGCRWSTGSGGARAYARGRPATLPAPDGPGGSPDCMGVRRPAEGSPVPAGSGQSARRRDHDGFPCATSASGQSTQLRGEGARP